GGGSAATRGAEEGSRMTRRLGLIAAGVWLLAAPAWAASFTVDSTGDDPDASPGDGTCATAGGACTLRAAIDEANANPDADTIAFDIAGSGVHTIVPAGGLPFITAPLTIDGFTQLGLAAEHERDRGDRRCAADRDRRLELGRLRRRVQRLQSGDGDH